MCTASAFCRYAGVGLRLFGGGHQLKIVDDDEAEIRYAAALGVHWKEEGLLRPDGLILCYPVITAGKYAHADSIRHLAGDSEMDYWSLEKHVTQDTPPTFIWHTVTDETVPMQNSILFTESLAEKGVPVELHLYPNGKHGLSLATKEVEECEKGRFADAHVADWFRLCLNWMERLA